MTQNRETYATEMSHIHDTPCLVIKIMHQTHNKSTNTIQLVWC